MRRRDLLFLTALLAAGCSPDFRHSLHRYANFEPRIDSSVVAWPHVYGDTAGQARAYIWPTERDVVTGLRFNPSQGVLYDPKAVFVGTGDTLPLAWTDADTAWRPSGSAIVAVNDSQMTIAATMQMARTPYGALAAGPDSLVLDRQP